MPASRKRTPLPRTRLPQPEEMLRRLMGASGHADVVEHFYAPLLRWAGRSLTAQGVIVKVMEATYEYASAMPPEERKTAQLVLEANYVAVLNALIIDDDVRTEAIGILARAEARRAADREARRAEGTP